MTKIEELEKKIEAKKAERAAQEEEQYEKDLEAKLELLDECGAIAEVKVSRFVPGFATRAFVRAPDAAEYKRYKDLIYRFGTGDGKSVKKQQEASEQLGKACWVYPAEDDQKAFLEQFPGILTTIHIAAAALAEGNAVDEGKG